jgi:hypothetical protein
VLERERERERESDLFELKSKVIFN